MGSVTSFFFYFKRGYYISIIISIYGALLRGIVLGDL